METKKVTTKTTATKAAAAKRTTARKACARKSSEVAINAQNIGFKAGDVYNALAAADKALSVEEIAKAAQISGRLGMALQGGQGRRTRGQQSGSCISHQLEEILQREVCGRRLIGLPFLFFLRCVFFLRYLFSYAPCGLVRIDPQEEGSHLPNTNIYHRQHRPTT